MAEGNVTLTAMDLPLNQGVLLANSLDKVFVGSPRGSQSDLLNSGAPGSASLLLDLTGIPTGSHLTGVVAGETRYWQAWSHDVGGAR